MAILGETRVDDGKIYVYTGSSNWKKSTDEFIKELINNNYTLEQRIEKLETVIKDNNILFD